MAQNGNDTSSSRRARIPQVDSRGVPSRTASGRRASSVHSVDPETARRMQAARARANQTGAHRIDPGSTAYMNSGSGDDQRVRINPNAGEDVSDKMTSRAIADSIESRYKRSAASSNNRTAAKGSMRPVGARRAPSAGNASVIAGNRPIHSSRDDDDASSRSTIHIIIVVILSFIYWPLAIIGIASPFIDGFNPGTLAMWQNIFTRVWLSIVLGGGFYAMAINLFHIRDTKFFSHNKAVKIIAFLVGDVVLSFVVIRIICML